MVHTHTTTFSQLQQLLQFFFYMADETSSLKDKIREEGCERLASMGRQIVQKHDASSRTELGIFSRYSVKIFIFVNLWGAALLQKRFCVYGWI